MQGRCDGFVLMMSKNRLVICQDKDRYPRIACFGGNSVKARPNLDFNIKGLKLIATGKGMLVYKLNIVQRLNIHKCL